MLNKSLRKDDDVAADFMKRHERHEALGEGGDMEKQFEGDGDSSEDGDGIDGLVTAGASARQAEEKEEAKEQREEACLSSIKKHLGRSVFTENLILCIRTVLVVASIAYAAASSSLEESPMPLVLSLATCHFGICLATTLLLHPGPLTGGQASPSMRKGLYLIDLVLRVKGLIGSAMQDVCCALCVSVASSALLLRLITLAAERSVKV